MKKMSLWIVIVTAAAMILSACGSKTADATAVPQSTQPQNLISEGRLLPLNSQDLYFTLSGQITEVLVKEGDAVTAGQVLARLTDSQEANAALLRAQQEELAARQALDALLLAAEVNLAQGKLAVQSAKAAFDQANDRFDANDSDLNKAQLDVATASLKLAEDSLAKLESGKGVDPDQQALAQARLASANAALKSAQSTIDGRVVKATMDGTVVDLSLSPGQQVAVGTSQMALADFSSWIVKTDNLTETDVIAISVGQKVEVVLDALPDKTFQGEVTQIASRYEEKRGDITFTVTIQLNQTDDQMRWGMTAAVHFLR
ncbi:MAG TPA: efflux RND transporter periplasmic adaptor subunit [Longilinea sp.]|nr:efflux RND transporter periplasmic adaptor subunit [Longilinea sp.]